MTKSEIALLVARGLAQEVFSHATLGHFNVTALRGIIAEAVRLGLTSQRCRFDAVRTLDGTDPLQCLIQNRELDTARCRELTPEQLEEPVIHLSCPAGTNGPEETHLLIDGVHRLVERHRRGYEDFAYYLVPLDLAPRPDPSIYAFPLPWGEKEVEPGVGLVNRKH